MKKVEMGDNAVEEGSIGVGIRNRFFFGTELGIV
jgi:hypothetical protein